MATKQQSGWADPKRQGDLLDALITVADLPASLDLAQRSAVVDFLHARGHTELNWNGIR